jgi:hypothetical protein
MSQNNSSPQKYFITGEQLKDLYFAIIGISPVEPYDPEDTKVYPIPNGELILKNIHDNQRM